MCSCDQRHFAAYADGDGEQRRLVVDGVCVCPHAGFTLALEPAGPEPLADGRDVVLRLRTHRPSAGPDTTTATPVRIFHRSWISAEAKRVVIRLPNDQTALVLQITEGEDH
jgi:hypothetical protein